jgi:lipoate-protein ligase A
MYGVLLSVKRRPECHSIDAAHRLVMSRLLSAVTPFVEDARFEGVCDLTVGGRKFSGNSLRCKRHHVLYHGTLLYRFDLEMLETLLLHPAREPDYRNRRSHDEFVRNVDIDPQKFRSALRSAWSADHVATAWPRAKMTELVEARYSRDAWNHRH